MAKTQRDALILVQARMGSSRLPGKVLRDIAGKPMLEWVVQRARRAGCAAQVAVATTTDAGDDAVEAFCRGRGIPVFRGSVYDVLDRFYQAAAFFEARTLVRLTADCPLIDPELIDMTAGALHGRLAAADFPGAAVHVQAFDERGLPVEMEPADSGEPVFDFAANRLPPPWKRTFPIGLDTEACTFAALERAWKEAAVPYEREHVTPFLYDLPGRFRVAVLDHQPDYGSLRWTVDTPEDLETLQQIAACFGGRDDFGWLEVLDLVERRPELKEINRQVAHKTMSAVDHRYTPSQGS
jgi:spore coat polysaccharide biosynthesis protein SpsF